MEEKKGKAHNAPIGFYTATEARNALGMSHATFHRNVGSKGLQIRRYVPVGAKEGFYSKEEVDLLVSLRDKGILDNSKLAPTHFQQATPVHAQGVVDVLESLGWHTTTAEFRVQMYVVNPEIDHVVLQGSVVMGYLSAIPYTDDAMEKRLHGKVEAWQLTPVDILPFENGKTYNLFVGLAERKKPEDKPNQFSRYGLRLVLGFRRFLMESLRERDIHIRFLLAHSAETDGQELADALGFVLQEPSPEDRYPIYVLDMEQSDAPWVRRYRELWKEGRD